MKERIVFLSVPQINQILTLLRVREIDGWCVGDRKQFEKREKRIEKELKRALEETAI